MSLSLWQQCLARLQDELPATEFSMWIRPLQAELSDNTLALYAPNRFVLDWVRDKYLNNINGLLTSFCGADAPQLRFEVGTKPVTQTPQAAVTSNVAAPAQVAQTQPQRAAPSTRSGWDNVPAPAEPTYRSNVNVKHTFDNFVEGKSNQLARAAARQVADNPGGAYNPLFLYGGTGLGKTHLLHAVGNGIMARKPNAKVVYMHSERFVQDMVKALQNNAIEEFKRYYRSVDALLIDDIQFFANKERSQEEFFHTFNALLEGNQQIILTSDRYPKEINGVEDRLKSRFGWRLTVAIEPPELDTRVAIMMKKADEIIAKQEAEKKKKSVASFRKKKRYIIALAAVLVLLMGTGVVGDRAWISDSSDLERETEVTTKVNNEDKGSVLLEEEAIYQEIAEKLGIAPMRLGYLPEGMVLDSYEIMQETGWVGLYYLYNEKVICVQMFKDSIEGSSNIQWDGNSYKIENITNQNGYEGIIEAYCTDEEHKNYVAVINYGNGHYNILGNFSSDEEFLKILNGIYFKNL